MTAQRHDPSSLLAWFERMIRTLRESPEVGAGTCTPSTSTSRPACWCTAPTARTGTMLFLHNLATNETDHCGHRRPQQ